MGDFGKTEGPVVGGTGAGKTNGAWTAAVRGIQAAMRVGDQDAARRLFDRLVAGEFGQPTELPPKAPPGQKPDSCAGCYAWAEVAARTGFTIDDLRVRAAAWPAAYFTEDGDCSQAGLDELLRQAESEGTVAATAYADAYRFAARTIQETPPQERGDLTDYFARVAAMTDRAAGFYDGDGEPLPTVTWADVEDAAAGSGCGELVEVAAGLDPAALAGLAGLLATLTPTGQPTRRTIDLFGAPAAH